MFAPSRRSMLAKLRTRINVSKDGGPQYAKNVDQNEIHSHAKLCQEASINGPGHTPRLEGPSTKGLGIGYSLLLAVAPPANCSGLVTVAMFTGAFPPLRWEVCASRTRKDRPLSLSIVSATDCVGSWWHEGWLLPASIDKEHRKQLQVPLFAKVGAIYVFSMEEKQIYDTMTEGLGSMASMGTVSSNDIVSVAGARRWKFDGFGLGGCVAMCCALLMPPAFVDSLVTFGSPPCVTVTQGLFPFPHTHVHHILDLTPHLLDASRANANLARLRGLGYLIPQPPVQVLKTAAFLHPENHIAILCPPATSFADKSDADLAVLALMPPSTAGSQVGRRAAREMDPPRLLTEGILGSYDVRAQHLYVTLQDYFSSIRLILDKNVDNPVHSRLPRGSSFLMKLLNPIGEFKEKRFASDVVALLPEFDRQRLTPASTPPNVSLAASQQAVQLPVVTTTTTRGGGKGAKAKKETPWPAAPLLAEAQRLVLQYPVLVEILLQDPSSGKTFPPSALLPPMRMAQQMQILGDTFESLSSFLKQFHGVAAWDNRVAARQLLEFGGVPPLRFMSAQMFITHLAPLFLSISIPRRLQPTRHVATAKTLEMLPPKVRELLLGPDGYHLSWTVAIASVGRGMGKSRLIRRLSIKELQTSMQSTYGGEDLLDVPMMKVKWSPPASTMPDRRLGKKDVSQTNPFLFRVTFDEVLWVNGSHGCKQALGYAPQILWMISDEYTFDQLVAINPMGQLGERKKYIGGGLTTHVHAIIYSPRTPLSPRSPTAASFDSATMYLETKIQRYCLENGYGFAAIDVDDDLSISTIQRLLIQWMLPWLKLPVDPRMLPPQVEVGSLVTSCDDALQEYLLRTAPLMRAVNRNYEVVDYEQLLKEQQMLLEQEQIIQRGGVTPGQESLEHDHSDRGWTPIDPSPINSGGQPTPANDGTEAPEFDPQNDFE